MVCQQTDAFHSEKEANYQNSIFFLKWMFCLKFPYFLKKIPPKKHFLPRFATTAYNMKSVLMIVVYFHVLNISEFGQIILCMIVTWEKSQNWKNKEKKTASIPIYPESWQFGIKKVSLLFSYFPRGKNTHESAQHRLCRIGLLINNKIEQEIFLYWALITSEVTEEEEGGVTSNEEGACRAMQE